MKKNIVVGTVLILTLLFVTACGVSQGVYDKINSDFYAAQERIQSLQDELSAAKTQVQSLQSELTTTQTEFQSLEDELNVKGSELTDAQTQIHSLQGDNESIRAKLEQAKLKVEILNDIFIPTLTGELYGMTESEIVDWTFKWRDKIVAVGDPTLTAKFQAIIDTGSDEATTEFFLYLMNSIAETLGLATSSSSI